MKERLRGTRKFSTFANHLRHRVDPPKFCIMIVLAFSWDMKMTRINAASWGQHKEHVKNDVHVIVKLEYNKHVKIIRMPGYALITTQVGILNFAH